MAQKRERSTNFTREEVDLLIKLAGEYRNVLENKKSDAVTWRKKELSWKKIEASFNCASGVTYRSSKNLRLKYEGIKKETRKKSALIRAETYRTGGGPSTAPVLTPSEEKVKEMILLTDSMESNCDSDNVPHAVEIISCPSIVPDIIDKNENIETPVCSIKRTLSKPQPKKTFEIVADLKLDMLHLQKTILEEELANNTKKWRFEENEREQQQKRWDFEEEERQHKREMWDLEKELILKKIKKE